MESKQKLMHIVGGGFNQIPLVKKAKQFGYQILVTDMNINPPCREFTDYYEQINTVDKEATLSCAEKYKIDYITADQTDVAIPTVAYVAEKLNLKGIGYSTALKFTNKYVMHKALEGKLDKHIPSSYYFDNENDAEEFCLSLAQLSEYVVKPVNSQGSKGVFILDYNYKKFISAAFKESFSRGIIIEKYIPGFEFSVESFVQDSKVYNLTLTKKYHYNTNPCLDERNTFLGDIDLNLERKIFDVNTKVINALGLSFGNTHAEYKVEGGNVYLIEIAARGAGGCISSNIIPFLTGFDPLESLLKALRDEPFEIKIEDYKKKFAVLKFFNFSPGKVKKVYLDKSIINNALVFNLSLKEGDIIHPVRDSRDRPGYFIVCGFDRENVLLKEKMIESCVRVEYFERNLVNN
ncbi:MAG: ATP-grasp domain-containing protein [Candidatus Melainabacteria bacterium]|nr:ATP-grasp domain-containing protein [Candidatus Melainabacteria bacterium]